MHRVKKKWNNRNLCWKETRNGINCSKLFMKSDHERHRRCTPRQHKMSIAIDQSWFWSRTTTHVENLRYRHWNTHSLHSMIGNVHANLDFSSLSIGCVMHRKSWRLDNERTWKTCSANGLDTQMVKQLTLHVNTCSLSFFLSISPQLTLHCHGQCTDDTTTSDLVEAGDDEVGFGTASIAEQSKEFLSAQVKDARSLWSPRTQMCSFLS
jgi:hypothetical protein